MDLQGALIVGGVTVVVCAVLILVSLLGSSGTSYEEAVAEQRRAANELLALAGANTKQALKKNKKAGKKAKEKKHKEPVQTGSERESDAPADSGQEEEAPPAPAPAAAAAPHPRAHVEFGESTVVDVPLDKPIKTQIRKRGKETKIKPILLNKEDVSCVSDPSTPPSPAASTASNHFEELHPKDEFELLHATLATDKVEKKEDVIERKETKPVKSGKGKHGKQAAPAPAPEPLPEEPANKERHNSGDSAKEQRKTKKNEKKQQVDESGDKPAKEEPATVAPLNLVSQPSDLTTDKILKQAVRADAHVSPPAAPTAPAPAPAKSKKNKKGEHSVMTLVGSDVGGVNVAELVRLVSEAALSRTEIQILTDALLNKQHGPLPQHSEWTEGPNDPVQKLKKQLAEKEKALTDEQEASQAVHAKLKELRASLNVERSRANAATRAAEEAVSINKVEVHTLQARMQRLLDDNHALTQEKHLLQSKLQVDGEAQAQRVQLEMHIQRLSEAEAALVSQLQVLQAELGARVLEVGQARCDAAAARDTVHQVQQHAADLAQKLQEANRACGELEAARASAAHAEQAASAELHVLSERVAELQAEVQRLPRASHTAMVERNLAEADRQNIQLSNEIKSLREQLAAKEEEIHKEHTNHQQNGLLPQEDNQKKAELLSVESALEAVRAELADAQAAHADQRHQLHLLQQQLQQHRDKNNEAVVKALEQQYRETAEVLRAACPQAAPSDAPVDKEWLAAFAQQLATVLRAAATDPDRSDADQLRGQNAHLQELVDKYKTIIDDTEGVLSRLQHNVTLEEQRWARLLHDKQDELDRLQQHTVTQMQSKIDSLQAEVERCARAPPARAPPTLADVERGLEETNRLLSISDKHPIESLNGPSQVGLEEK